MITNSLVKLNILCKLTGWNSLEMVLLCQGFLAVDQYTDYWLGIRMSKYSSNVKTDINDIVKKISNSSIV